MQVKSLIAVKFMRFFFAEEKPCAMQVQRISDDDLPSQSIVAGKVVKGSSVNGV